MRSRAGGEGEGAVLHAQGAQEATLGTTSASGKVVQVRQDAPRLTCTGRVWTPCTAAGVCAVDQIPLSDEEEIFYEEDP